MKKPSHAPTGQPQSFEITETFFSTTDARGVITAGNSVFSRTSGYRLEEMVGRPHNLIRHPAMPRLVFRLLWETIRAGNPFMGYVQNLARNGNHYWVFAVVVPLPAGYLSVRIRPTSSLLASVEGLYRRLLEREEAAVADGRSEGDAAECARETLAVEIRRLGFEDYETFSHHALNTEIVSRDREVQTRSLRLFPADIEAETELRVAYAQTRAVYEGVASLFGSLDAFVELCRGIRKHQQAVERISEEFRINAFNAHIAANPLGASGLTLGTVAQVLNSHGQSLARNVGALTGGIVVTTDALTAVTSNLAAARIQIEMLLTYLVEIAGTRYQAGERRRLHAIVGDLKTGFSTTLQQAFSALDTVRLRLPEVLATKEQLRKDIVYLQVAQISGLVEVSRLANVESLHATFVGLRDQIESGQRELEELDTVVERLQTLANAAPPQVQAIGRDIAKMESALRWDAVASPSREATEAVAASVN